MKYEETPATKADVRVLTEKLDALADRLDQSIKSLMDSNAELRERVEQGFHRANEYSDQILAVLCSADEHWTGKAGSHEQRIQRLERHLGLTA